jgi:hypothetical protein
MAVAVFSCGTETAGVVESVEPLSGPEVAAGEAEQALAVSAMFPLRTGNSWTLSGQQAMSVKVGRGSGSAFIVEGLSTSPVWMAFSGSRLMVWNGELKQWQTFINFGGSTETQFSLGGVCERFRSKLEAERVTVKTAAGTFTNARRYSVTLNPPPQVRCAAPVLGDLTFVENVGLVEVNSPKLGVVSLEKALVNGKAIPQNASLRASLTIKSSKYQIDPGGNVNMSVTFAVRNETDRAVTLPFSSSQQFELQIVDASGETLYTWSADKSFLAALSNLTLKPGQSEVVNETFNVQFAKAGTFTVNAWMPTMRGEQPRASASVEFVAPSCFIGGCSGQVCSDRQGVISTCEWRPEYACYQSATCERQADGQCGWTQTTALLQCLKNP